jgi:DNA-binding CsgD family transcriptional regulator
MQAWPPTPASTSSVQVLEGPAGIGKSHRLAELLATALAAGVRILRAQPSQAETRLVGSALIDLCSGVSDDEIATLPEVQANALMTALLRGSTSVGNPEAISLAFTGLLRSLATAGPIVIAVDDVQWIDEQTADVLTFAGRRMPGTGVCVLLARRTTPHGAVPPLVADLSTALAAERTELSGLPDAAVETLLRERLGAALPRADVASAIELAGGNPLFAVEIARASLAARSGGIAAGTKALPDSLYDAIGHHLAALDAPAQQALAAAAALGRPRLHHLRALDADLDLGPAEQAGLVRVVHGTIEFAHPLYAAAAYDQLSAGERGRLHRRLADVVDGGEERARHLALGASEPDETVAEALDAASQRAMTRGALIAALDAANLAMSATPADSTRRTQRLIRIGELLYRAGSTDRALAQLSAALESATTDRDRAHALHARACVVQPAYSIYEAADLERQALDLVGDDLELRADILNMLAVSTPDDYDTGLQYAAAAREILERLPAPDPVRLAAAMTNEAGARFYAGGGADIESVRRVVDLQAGDTSAPVMERAVTVLGYLLLWTDDFPGARDAFATARQMSIDEGDDSSLLYVVRNLAAVETRAGRWREAEQLIDEYEELAERLNQPYYLPRAALDRAKIALYRGDAAAALAISEDHIERGVAGEQLLMEQLGRGVRGLVAVVEGDAPRAATELDRYVEIFTINNAAEPALREYAGDHIEALVLAGRDVDAEKAIHHLVEISEPLGRTVMLAAAARGKALLLAERGEIEAALECAEQALVLYRTIERPFETAGTHLVKGQIHRRLRQKALARREFTAALTIYTELGANGFAERTQREIDRIGGRAPAPLELTETERRVAERAASGMTTAEIATALFISTHTVSANLTRVFRKLNIRNRTELAARLDGKDSGTTPAS